MLKWLAVLVLAFTPLATAGLLSGQTAPLGTPEQGITKPYSGKGGQDYAEATNGKQTPKNAPTNVEVHNTIADDAAKKPANDAANESLNIQRKMEWFTGVLALVGALQVWILVGTLIAIKRQASHMETSERAWLVAIPENAQIPPSVDNPSGVVLSQCSVRYVNTGKTPAFVLEIGHRAVVQDMKQPLPDIQPAYAECAPVGSPMKEVSKWDGDGFPVQPESHIIKNWIGTWSVSAKRIRTGFDFFWVYGYVKYRDTFGHSRETWYCYRWDPGIGTNAEPTFTADGPKGYNRVT
jgi:hypothetical protein